MGPCIFFESKFSIFVELCSFFRIWGLKVFGQEGPKSMKNGHNSTNMGNFDLKKIQGSHNWGGIMGTLYFFRVKILNTFQVIPILRFFKPFGGDFVPKLNPNPSNISKSKSRTPHFWQLNSKVGTMNKQIMRVSKFGPSQTHGENGSHRMPTPPKSPIYHFSLKSGVATSTKFGGKTILEM